MTRQVLMLSVLLVAGCAGAVGPATFDPAHEPCRFCRMVGSNGRFAAQLVAPGQDPLYFDDIGCLLQYARASAERSPGAEAFVADHRTGAWVSARQALYVRHDAIETPMGSRLMAFASVESRDQDQAAAGGETLSFARVFEGTGSGS
jgi:copper chaperone NosL